MSVQRLHRSVVAWLMAIGIMVAGQTAEVRLLNVSYDVTREFYQDVNAAFAVHWKAKTGDTVVVNQSHGGSSKQVRSVMDGLEADVVTMNQSLDIDILHDRARLIPSDWASRLPYNSAPYTSTIVFMVRKGNPQGIRGWDDLVKSSVSVIIPNPKTSGNGRYSYLAAWGYALRRPGGDEAKAREFVGRLFKNVPVLDTGGRGATTTFAQRGIGDVLLTFESEVHLTRKEFGDAKFDVVYPSVSILAEAPVTWVDRYASKHGTVDVARGYLEFLFTDAGQELAAKHHLRPRVESVLARHTSRFASIPLLKVEDIVGGWAKAQKVHFNEGGVFDQIYQKGR